MVTSDFRGMGQMPRSTERISSLLKISLSDVIARLRDLLFSVSVALLGPNLPC